MRLLTAVSLVRVQLGELFYARKGRESSGRNEIDETCKIQMNVSCRFFATHEKPFSDTLKRAACVNKRWCVQLLDVTMNIPPFDILRISILEVQK